MKLSKLSNKTSRNNSISPAAFLTCKHTKCQWNWLLLFSGFPAWFHYGLGYV